MEAVVGDREEGHRQLLTEGVAVAEAHPVEHGPAVEQAGEGTDQIEEGLGAEHAGVAACVDRGVVQVADGALGGLVDAAGKVEVVGSVGQAHGAGAAGLAARLLGLGIEIHAGGGEALHAAGASAVEVQALAAALGQAVVGHGADGRMALQQLALRIPQGLQQAEDRPAGAQRLIQLGQGGRGQGREGRRVVGVAEGAGGPGAAQGLLQALRGEVGGAGDSHQTVVVPHAHRDRTALGSLHLLGLAPVHLHGGVGAAGGAQVPPADSLACGQLVELGAQLFGIKRARSAVGRRR